MDNLRFGLLLLAIAGCLSSSHGNIRPSSVPPSSSWQPVLTSVVSRSGTAKTTTATLVASSPSSPSSSPPASPSSSPSASPSSSPKPKVARVNVSFKYHKYEELTKLLKTIAKKFPRYTRLYTIGKSAEKRELWVLQVTENPQKEVPLKPNVKYVANMHGNEAVGRELMLHLIAHLVNNANKSANVRSLLRHTNIYILPSLNPDGFELAEEGVCEGKGRRNALNFDLNRNFPDRLFSKNLTEQPETRAVRQWIAGTQFVLSANLHGGALVVNYPFDNSRNRSDDHAANTPDHDVFHHLSLVYAKKHPKMRYRSHCTGDETPFENGITNGNDWYPIQGSMQDYNYVFGGCMELTLELSCCKYPNASNLHRFWSENKVPLLTFLTEAHKGVKGVVQDSNNELPLAKANLTILGREVPFQTDKRGQFWRILLPGDYVLVVQAAGYRTLQKQFTVTENKITIVNVYMAPIRRSRTSQAHFWTPTRTGDEGKASLAAIRAEPLTSSASGCSKLGPAGLVGLFLLFWSVRFTGH